MAAAVLLMVIYVVLGVTDNRSINFFRDVLLQMDRVVFSQRPP